MMSEMQIHTIARQMMEKHGLTAIAQAAHNAQACESKGDAEEATEWRHIEDAMKMMRGPHQSSVPRDPKADGANGHANARPVTSAVCARIVATSTMVLAQ